MFLVAALALGGLFLLESVLHVPVSPSGYLFLSSLQKPASLDEFAACLEKKGAVLYTTEWCSQCRNQELLFGASYARVPQVNCTPEGKLEQVAGQCVSKGITYYPTWVFENQETQGTLSFLELSQATGCRLP